MLGYGHQHPELQEEQAGARKPETEEKTSPLRADAEGVYTQTLEEFEYDAILASLENLFSGREEYDEEDPGEEEIEQAVKEAFSNARS